MGCKSNFSVQIQASASTTALSYTSGTNASMAPMTMTSAAMSTTSTKTSATITMSSAKTLSLETTLGLESKPKTLAVLTRTQSISYNSNSQTLEANPSRSRLYQPSTEHNLSRTTLILRHWTRILRGVGCTSPRRNKLYPRGVRCTSPRASHPICPHSVTIDRRNTQRIRISRPLQLWFSWIRNDFRGCLFYGIRLG